MNTLTALFSSRKFWLGTLTIAAVCAAAALVAMGKLPASELTATIASITAVGVGVIGSIAWEDVAKHNAGTPPGPEPKSVPPPRPPMPAMHDAGSDDKPTPAP